VKANKGTQLVLETVPWGDMPLDRTQRYLISQSGDPMFKIMPPLAKKPDVWRRIAVEKGYKVVPCNNIHQADGYEIDYDWYASEIYKLVLGVV